MSINIDNDYPSTYTKNLNLEKQPQEQFYNVDVFNNNFDKIDEAIVSVASPNKLLKLDKDGKLPTSVTGDAHTVDGKHATDFAPASFGLGEYQVPAVDPEKSLLGGIYRSGYNPTGVADNTMMLTMGLNADYTAQFFIGMNTKRAFLRTRTEGKQNGLFREFAMVDTVANNYLNTTNNGFNKLNFSGNADNASIYFECPKNGDGKLILETGDDGDQPIVLQNKDYNGKIIEYARFDNTGLNVNGAGHFSKDISLYDAAIISGNAPKIVFNIQGVHYTRLMMDNTGCLHVQDNGTGEWSDIKAKKFIGNLEGTANNADTVDGHHIDTIMNTDYTVISNDNVVQNRGNKVFTLVPDGNSNMPPGYNYGTLVGFNGGSAHSLLYISHQGDLCVNGCWENGWGGWKKFATIDQIPAIDSGFTQSLAQNGWCKLPNGLILQWGTAKSYSDNAYPISFPHAAFKIIFGGSISYNLIDNTKFHLEDPNISDSGKPETRDYLAIGY